MAIKLKWLSGVNGERRQLYVSVLDCVLKLELVGDVIIASNWSLTMNAGVQLDSEWAEKIQSCVLQKAGETGELKLLKRGTAYSQAVWNALYEIPPGEVMTYSKLAEKLGSGPRAIAQACRTNPYPGVIPCHRVVSKSGLGGFVGQNSGPWLEFKRQLLANEHDVRQRSA